MAPSAAGDRELDILLAKLKKIQVPTDIGVDGSLSKRSKFICLQAVNMVPCYLSEKGLWLLLLFCCSVVVLSLNRGCAVQCSVLVVVLSGLR